MRFVRKVLQSIHRQAAAGVVAATTGLTATIAGGSPVPSSSAPTLASVNYSFAAGVSSGTITITITSPSGLSTSVGQYITTNNAPNGYVACF